jgi:phosphoesterase RecJ-like protein
MSSRGSSKVRAAIKKIILSKDNFLITSHAAPDGDAIGSQIALALILQKLGKKVFIVNPHPVPPRYQFLPEWKLIRNKHPAGFSPEVLFILDCSEWKRTGQFEKRYATVPYKINIDHHVTNQYFGDINYVDVKISSVGEQIYLLSKLLKVVLTREIATCLYIAIITDTGEFKYKNTSPETHRIVSKLLETGLNPAELMCRVYESHSLNYLKLLNLTLTSLRLIQKGKIALLKTSFQMFKKARVPASECDNFINYPLLIKSVVVVCYFREMKPGEIKVTFRSKSPKLNVGEFAFKLGGGGHAQASGCLIKGSLEEVKKKVVKILKEKVI